MLTCDYTGSYWLLDPTFHFIFTRLSAEPLQETRGRGFGVAYEVVELHPRVAADARERALQQALGL